MTTTTTPDNDTSASAVPFILEMSPGVHRVFSHAGVSSVQSMVDQLAELDGSPGQRERCADIGRVDLLGELERLKAAAAAAQARITAEFEASQLAQQDRVAEEARAAGNEARAKRLGQARGRGIGDQVALARNESTHLGAKHVGFARAMNQMPHTLALLTEGSISEWTAEKLVAETAVLTAEDRAAVDVRLCATRVDTTTGEICVPEVLGLTPHRVEGRARALAQELDPEAAVRRAAKATRERRVTIRATPSTMTYVTGLLPVADGVAAYASLDAAARAAKAAGDERSLAQLRADLFVQRVTGKPPRGQDAPADGAVQEADGAEQEADGAEAPTGDRPGPVTDARVPVHLNLVMGADTFTGDSDRPGRVDDTVIPGQVARAWVHDPDTPVTIRRLFTDPATGQVTEVDPRSRHHSAADKRFLRLRDQHCRMPGCDRPIDDADHPERYADGGPTTRANGQGLCEGHNLAKEAPGWRTRVIDPRPGHHEVEIITPTGHVYRSKAPPAMPPPM